MLRQMKEEGPREYKAPGTRRGLMVLKIFLGMEWMLILGGDLGLFIYLVLLISFRLFGLENREARGDYAFLPLFLSFPRSAVRILSSRATIKSMTRQGAGAFGRTVISRLSIKDERRITARG
jgi:hypothetical protein